MNDSMLYAIDHPTSIRAILANPHGRRWTIQGFGMLRTYLTEDETVRLHVWSLADKVPGVSVIHDHPWDFTSDVISGEIVNRRYDMLRLRGEVSLRHLECWSRPIVCGEDGCMLGEPERVVLVPRALEKYREGESYSQTAAELHASFPSDGAVTVITRRFGADRDVARVCWNEDAGPDGWVSAEPREATREEVERITAFALLRWGARGEP